MYVSASVCTCNSFNLDTRPFLDIYSGIPLAPELRTSFLFYSRFTVTSTEYIHSPVGPKSIQLVVYDP